MPAELTEQPQSQSLNLESSTLDEVISALSTGIPIALPENGDHFTLDTEDARTLFRFYASHRDLWSQQKQIVGREVDNLLMALESPQPAPHSIQVATTTLKCLRWRITQVRAHRFAGLHHHCDTNGTAPDSLILDLDRDVTCIWGFNGAGKTALQNAIMWCLTGHTHRSQHKPIEAHEPIEIDLRSESTGDDSSSQDLVRRISLPPIVPLPSATALSILQDKPACDTWVELTLRERSGQEAVVKRELKLSAKGAISNSETGLELLGLPQWALEVGTLMPAIAATMRFDEKTTFAGAIAKLTGLKPLEDLGKRSKRLARRLSGDDLSTAEKDKAAALHLFLTNKSIFEEGWENQSETFGEPPNLFTPEEETEDKSCQAAIEFATLSLEELRKRGQKDIESILGVIPVLETKEQMTSFGSVLSLAKERLGTTAIQTLPSIETIKQLRKIHATDREITHTKLQELSKRAVAQIARQQNQKEAARWQLYTMVSQWHLQHHPNKPLSDCPVCNSDLTQVPPDALLDKAVVEALKISAKADSDAAKTMQDWQRDAIRELSESLPQSLKPFFDTKLASSLLDIYRKAYVDELFNHDIFKTQLQTLKQNANSIWILATKAYPLPDLPSTDSTKLPQELQGSSLALKFSNLQAALTLSEYRQLSEEQLKAIGQRYFGSSSFNRSEFIQEEFQEISHLPLRHQLIALQQAVDSSQPTVVLIRQIKEIETHRQSWQRANKRHQLLKRAATAVQQFSHFPRLVHHQVEGLLQTLENRTKDWLNIIYRPHYVGGPSYTGIDPSISHGVGLYAELGSLRVHAHEVMNSSHLRACVWAFLFSLWERIRDQTGVLDTLLLDDPQTSFDPINTENLAAAIPKLVHAGMVPIITSNDNRFITAIKGKLPKFSTSSPSWTMLQISPISSSRFTAAFTPSVEEVFERQEAWREDESNVSKAQDFVERVRLYIENRLWDLLAADPMYLPNKPTLADLINHIGKARNGGERPFTEPPFERLLSCRSLKPDSPFYSNINHAHHNLRNITPNDAQQVSDALDKVDRLLHSCSSSYARFMGRLIREDEELLFSSLPPAPPAIVLNKQQIQVLGDFSARTYANAIAIDNRPKPFSFDSLGEVTLFTIRGFSLGALALPGQVVIASLTAQAKNGDPVIALFANKVLARRYYSDQSDPSKVTLICDQSGSENIAPAMTLPLNKVRTLPIVGILYDEENSNVGNNEAYPVTNSSILGKSLAMAHITENSGYPVVRNKDLVLLEQLQTPTKAILDRMKGSIVALVASQHGDHYAYLKRLGSSIEGNLRMFENVGTFGDSLAVLCPETEDFVSAGSLMTLQNLWCVHGVIRTTAP